MRNRQHICVLTSAHAIDDVRANSKIVASFLDKGYRVSWVGPDLTLGARDPRVSYHFTQPNRTRMDRMLSARRAGRKAREVSEVDWYYSPDPDAAEFAVRLARKNNCLVIFDIHEIFHGALLDNWLRGRELGLVRQYVRRRIAKTAAQSDLVVGVSDSVLHPYVGFGTNSLRVRNCAPRWFAEPLEGLDIKSPKSALETGTISFMHGKALSSNGTDMVLSALDELGPDRRSVKVFMFEVESPRAKPYAQSRIDEIGLNLRSSLVILKSIPHAEMPNVLKKCEVGMVSYGRDLGRDSLPNRLFEYMAGGLAILAPDYATEIKKIVDEEEIGLTVDFEDTRAIADAMRWFAENRTETARMGRRSREAFEKRHNWDTEFGRLVAAMESMC